MSTVDARSSTSAGAIAVASKGIAANGVPQRLPSDNGAALNPSRRGVLGQLVAYVTSPGLGFSAQNSIEATSEVDGDFVAVGLADARADCGRDR